MEIPRDLNPQAPPFTPTSSIPSSSPSLPRTLPTSHVGGVSITLCNAPEVSISMYHGAYLPPSHSTASSSILFQHLTQTPLVCLPPSAASHYPHPLPSNVPPYATHLNPQTIYSPYHTYSIQSQPTPVPPPFTHVYPRPPPYTHCYVVQPPPCPSSTNVLPISSPPQVAAQQPGLPPSLLVYNIFNQRHNLMPLPQRPPVEVNEQFVTPPVTTTQHTDEVRVNTHARVGPRATKYGFGRGGSRVPRGGRATNGFGRGGSLNLSNRREGFGRGGSLNLSNRREGSGRGVSSRMANTNREGFGDGRRVHMQESRGDESLRYGKFSSWKETSKEEKHQVIPVRPDEAKTTVMIKNIPYGYNREKLIEFLDDYCLLENEKARDVEEHFVSAYDFAYLPIDFGTKRSRGFAFVNFTDPRAVWKFLKAFHNKLLIFGDRAKTVEIVCAKIQGKEALVDHFERAKFECDTDEFLPLCFMPARDGSVEPVKQTTIGKRCARYGKNEASPSRGLHNHQT